MLKVLLMVLFSLAVALSNMNKKKREAAKITLTKAIILLIAKQVYHATYRKLAARKDILEPLSLCGIIILLSIKLLSACQLVY